jgi:predicted oxidoreductase
LRALPFAYGSWCFAGSALRETRGGLALALAFLLAHPTCVIPILGRRRIARIGRSTDAPQVYLPRGDWEAVPAAAQGAPHP